MAQDRGGEFDIQSIFNLLKGQSFVEQIINFITGKSINPTIYSVDYNNERFPSLTPRTIPYLVPLIRSGAHPGIPEEWVRDAYQRAQEQGNTEPSPGNVPSRSPLGSEFEFPFYESWPRIQNSRWETFKTMLEK